MGRENILKYQLEHDHETDLPQTSSRKDLDVKIRNSHFPFTLSKDSTIQDYLSNNKFFVDSINHNHSPEVFALNGKGQQPHTLWIGCADSRAGEGCLSVLPGEIFTHRNIGNIVNSSDISSQGVIQFAIEVLKVRKIIVCGHTDCGGVWASMSNKKIGGVLDLWLNPIRHIRAQNRTLLNSIEDPKEKATKLSELNVISSVLALKRHPSASMALKNGEIEVWGMLYNVSTGHLQEVEVPADEFEDLFHVHDNEDLVH
ncbi:carbonic anhydrase [Yamadazyma tenuis]|uniref:Carbonic anhydrase n=1 Tax=Candida tenuis (strain ATCC 10573 / BCRC 21748 / CBS 615 / JCM 9827 / NBRC 10315 / NRRL Y-1498 / VKM Y-70) TaxID=590646 RepID=G3B8E4_CANTC|nr:carbonic anhydrase [Yamadazyma tenuis ATCC 10573]EGV62381.1 carbonic anhydrase [Yamadazyma tenuis ATCC 10573]WEJ93644.1 carbonic anhydrase [Yamadazyma tenuis]